MRAEVERAYQGGGLAAATAQEEETPEPLLTVDEIVERTTNPGAGQSLTSMMIIQNKDQAMERLRSGRANITARREEARKREAQDRWLAFGQAMLSPSRTGGLGENIGMAAGAIREESARSAAAEEAYSDDLENLAAQEIAAESNAIDQLLTQAGHGSGAKNIHGAIQTMVHEDDRHLPVAQQRLVFGSLQQQKDGSWQLMQLEDADGNAFEAADRLDPARAAAVIEATETMQAQTGRGQEMIDEAYSYRNPIADVRRANAIFENADTIIKTSGIQELKNRLANWVGVDLGDTIELTELQMIASQDYLDKLTRLKGNTSDRDVQEMKGISVGIGKNATTNYRRLKRMEAIYSTAIRRGIREAYQSKEMDAVGDLWEAAEGNRFYAGTPFIKNEEGYKKLAPGTSFYMEGEWGGVRYTKPAKEEEE